MPCIPSLYNLHYFYHVNSIACIGAILWSLLNCTHGWKLYLQFSVYAFGVYASRIYTATLALTLLCINLFPRQRLDKITAYLLASGVVIPTLLVGIQLLTVAVILRNKKFNTAYLLYYII